MSIFTDGVLNVGSVCYGFVAPRNKPAFFIRFKAVVIRTVFEENHLAYIVRITKILESKTYLKKWLPQTEWFGYSGSMKNRRFVTFDEYNFRGDIQTDIFKFLDVRYLLTSYIIKENKSEMLELYEHTKNELRIQVDEMKEQLK